MSQHIWISSDESIDWDNRSWITNRFVFNNIFERVKSCFKPSELACKDACFLDWGIEGIELSYVDKECFNTFYLRCRIARDRYANEKATQYEDVSEVDDQRETHEHVAWEWTEILKRLELDKRYNPLWIENYLREQG